jgi:hypothetical protein
VKRQILSTLLSVLALGTVTGQAGEARFCGLAELDSDVPKLPRTVRFATFNASLNRNGAGELVGELAHPDSPQPQAVAEIIQRTAPEVLLINEFDWDRDGAAARLFQENYLALSQNGAPPIHYPYVYVAPRDYIVAPFNTGLQPEDVHGPGFDLDLDRDGETDGPGDAFGFGSFPGHFALVVYSKYPIERRAARTFQTFLWRDMPGALLPTDPDTGESYYTAAELSILRLSSKSHWDLPIEIGGRTVHLLASHPTPPVFDGPEDRNGKRNHDEIRLWADYVRGGHGARYIYDDRGRRGGLKRESPFVIMGDQNADPFDGDSTDHAIDQLLDHPAVDATLIPASFGGIDAAERNGGANEHHIGNPAFDTADFNDSAPGNLRVDYVLPSRAGLEPICAGVFWPAADDPLFRLVGDFPSPSSDHRLVWLDLRVLEADDEDDRRHRKHPH